jgi:hypothetical protein
MKLSIQAIGIDKALGEIRSSAAKVPSRAASMLNTGAFAARTALQDEMSRTFKGGVTPFLRSSVRVKLATPQNLVAEVAPDDFLRKPSGAAPTRLLTTQVKGKERATKASENALRQLGLLPPGMFIVPGQDAPLDQYGNIDARFMRSLISYFKTQRAATSAGPNTEKLQRKIKRTQSGRVQYFALQQQRSGRSLRPGIYKRIEFAFGSALSPMLLFVRRPSYEARLKWAEVAKPAALNAIAKAWAAR